MQAVKIGGSVVRIESITKGKVSLRIIADPTVVVRLDEAGQVEKPFSDKSFETAKHRAKDSKHAIRKMNHTNVYMG
jgi:hypothetical protein